jgi:pimeloyl-ACP methyl ester carboxylesterase
LPIVEGVRRNNVGSLIDSVFHNPADANPGLRDYYQKRFADRRWRTGVLRTVRGTMEHRVRDRLPAVTQPTLLVVGSEDRIVDPQQTAAAAALLPRGELNVLAGCGHAPQIEKAGIINRLVVDFLRGVES